MFNIVPIYLVLVYEYFKSLYKNTRTLIGSYFNYLYENCSAVAHFFLVRFFVAFPPFIDFLLAFITTAISFRCWCTSINMNGYAAVVIMLCISADLARL